MGSSQGAVAGSTSQSATSQIPTVQITPGYTYTQTVLRDSSDWTTLLKQRLVYAKYSQTPVPQTNPPWLNRGNNFRLTYLMGQFKCNSGTCSGGAFGGSLSAIAGPLIT